MNFFLIDKKIIDLIEEHKNAIKEYEKNLKNIYNDYYDYIQSNIEKKDIKICKYRKTLSIFEELVNELVDKNHIDFGEIINYETDKIFLYFISNKQYQNYIENNYVIVAEIYSYSDGIKYYKNIEELKEEIKFDSILESN
jgi:hypothetical protein